MTGFISLTISSVTRRGARSPFTNTPRANTTDPTDPNRDDPTYVKMQKIKSQVERMSAITQKLMGITRYETRKYVKGTRIVDIEKSSTTFD